MKQKIKSFTLICYLTSCFIASLHGSSEPQFKKNGRLVFENNYFTFSGSASYHKETLIKNAEVHANGEGVIFPHLVSVTDSSLLIHETSNNYSPGSSLYIVNGGHVDFGATDQTLLNLLIYKGSAIGANATVSLLSAQPTIIVKGETSIGIKNLNLLAGGYMQFSSLNGILDGNLCQDGYMTLDLGGANLNLDAHQLDIVPPFSVGFNNVVITNGTIFKYGPAGVFFAGHQGNIPNMVIQEGDVYIGKAVNDIVAASGIIEIVGNGCLGGFGTLNCQGFGKVYNAGTLKPGNAHSSGTLRIAGTYSQSSSGSLHIRAQNANVSDKLIVDKHEATLDGRLFLHVETADALKPGDEIIILDNTNTLMPIAGAFSSFETNLPSHLTANIQYKTNQIKILIISR